MMHKRDLPTVLLIIAASLELFLYLNRGALIFDEAIYAEVAQEIVRRHEWLTLHWNGMPWFEKPPLYMWGTALLFNLFGMDEVWARVISAACGVGVVWVSLKIANLIGGPAAGFLTVVILLSSPLFVVYARFGTTDICLTFCVVVAFYACLRAVSDSRFWIVAWLAFGFAIMVKGAAGFAVLAVLGLGVLVEGQLRRSLSDRLFWLGLAIAVAIVAPWHIGMYVMHGDSFVSSYLVRHVLKRSTTDLNLYNAGYDFYLWALVNFFFPWIYLLPFAVIFEAKRKRSFVLILFSALVLIVYTAVTTKFQWYILPAIPAFSVVISCFLAQTIPRLHPLLRQVAYVGIALLFIAGLARSVIYSLPDRELESASRLARAASADEGPITTYPNDLEMTVVFYSGRRLCAHPRPIPLPYSENTKCNDVQPRNIIFRTRDEAKVESFYEIAVRFVDADVKYAEILGARK